MSNSRDSAGGRAVTRVSCTVEDWSVWSLLRGHSLVTPMWSQFSHSYVVTVWSLLRGRSWVTPTWSQFGRSYVVTVGSLLWSLFSVQFMTVATPREKARMILPILPLFVLSDFHVLYEPFVLLLTVV